MDVEVRVLFWAPPYQKYLYLYDFYRSRANIGVPFYLYMCTILGIQLYQVDYVTTSSGFPTHN